MRIYNVMSAVIEVRKVYNQKDSFKGFKKAGRSPLFLFGRYFSGVSAFTGSDSVSFFTSFAGSI